MKDPRGVGPSKGNQGTTRGKEKILLTSVGIEPTTFVPPFVFIILRGTTFIESANTSLPTLVSRVKAALPGAALFTVPVRSPAVGNTFTGCLIIPQRPRI